MACCSLVPADLGVGGAVRSKRRQKLIAPLRTAALAYAYLMPIAVLTMEL